MDILRIKTILIILLLLSGCTTSPLKKTSNTKVVNKKETVVTKSSLPPKGCEGLSGFAGMACLAQVKATKPVESHRYRRQNLSSLMNESSASLYRATRRKKPPKSHVWQYLYSIKNEELGFATYSYVLAGRDDTDPITNSRYLAIVKAIQSSTVSKDRLLKQINPKDFSREKYNKFLIPSKYDINNKNTPNYDLSKTLISALELSSPISLNDPGPFIITLYKPISFHTDSEVTDIMYFDFSGINEKAIPEIIKVYKSRVKTKNLAGIEILESFKLSFLNVALKLEDSLGFAKAAFANIKSTFFKEPDETENIDSIK